MRRLTSGIARFAAAAFLLAGATAALRARQTGGADRLAGGHAKAGSPPDALSHHSIDNEARLAGIIRSSMEAIITVDEQQRVVLFNPMAETLFGWKAEEALGRPLGDFIPQRFRAAHERHVRRFGVTGVSERQMGQQRTLYALRQDGVEFPIEASISQTLDGGGKLYTVMLRDTTERVLSEQAMRRSREELQQLSESILSAREEEKRRVACELHDDIGQRLSAFQMDLAMLEEDLRDAGVAGSAARQIEEMHSVIDETVKSVRRIAADLRPALLDELGLVPAIEWLAKDVSARYGIHIESHTFSGEIPVPEQTGTAIFRIVQEALNNVARHSGATAVEISLERHGECYHLLVRDNGRGWDGKLPETTKRASFGLLGIRERVRLIGGTVSISQTPGRGLSLLVRFPSGMPSAEGGDP
ncbi:PAS domain-containing sensor histidine kinase [Cupriavidus sp. USMAHM13]|uniref:PAS domain-containing sensor histidine kinase n=1 Tax=Cupriavidus sp. USMAHM13 TaxID=1389192 RepID=UPI0009F4057A|nr:PAS domain-containing sensor histidine kinase [Cupriavidus sp. USMAHM13]